MIVLLAAGAQARTLRVCADPANLPFSNRSGQGFENEIAAIIARDLGMELRYVWRPQVGHYLKPLREGACDVIMGMTGASKSAVLTRPYYRSSYVLLSRATPRPIRSLDDPRLKSARIGVQVIGAEQATSPAGAALARRGLIRNAAWYRLVQTYVTPNENDTLVRAVARGEVGAAIAWGPSAGFFARRSATPIAITPIAPRGEGLTPMAFDIAVGVRPGAGGLRRSIDRALARRSGEIRRILLRFGVPLVAPTKGDAR